VLGPEDKDTLGFMVLLAWTLVQRREIKTAEALLLKVIEIGERTGRGEEIFAIDAKNELGWAYNHGHQPHKAIPLFRSALRFRTSVLGPKDTGALWSMHGLAYAYKLLKRFRDALPLYQNVLELRTEVLGRDDEDTLAAKRELDSISRSIQESRDFYY